ncbi:1-aminocyclopropane-1-carboxylate deaminase [Candidatus Calditenuaceae archaeon HR02]|nr:1-aminocyclopropane-1-carboxylate deaminase [Candidatus Calditenuaceae archaeon HR02]
MEVNRVSLGFYPTPFHPMTNLSRHLKGPRIYVKRDDLTGLALGGNKTRILEYVLGDVVSRGADVVIATSGVQSNWARQITAAARILGIKPVLVLRTAQFTGTSIDYTGNLLLDYLMGADARIVEASIRDNILREMEKVADEYRAMGHNPAIITDEPAVGVLGYYDCAREIIEQSEKLGIEVDYVVHATSGGPTQAGLILGFSAAGKRTKVIGVNSAAYDRATTASRIRNFIEKGAELINLDKEKLSSIAVEVLDGYGDYGEATEEVIDAILLTARLEGIILDPVYSGKAMAGLIDMIQQRQIDNDANVVFIHTGGIPAVFAYKELLFKKIQSLPQ